MGARIGVAISLVVHWLFESLNRNLAGKFDFIFWHFYEICLSWRCGVVLGVRSNGLMCWIVQMHWFKYVPVFLPYILLAFHLLKINKTIFLIALQLVEWYTVIYLSGKKKIKVIFTQLSSASTETNKLVVNVYTVQ